MNQLIVDPVELRRKGFDVLVDALGWINAVRFIQQYEQGRGDYTKERHAILPDWTAEEIVRKASDLADR
jgi:hypothetical protein